MLWINGYGLPGLGLLVAWATVGLLGLVVNIYFFAILAMIIIGWVAPGSNHPAIYLSVPDYRTGHGAFSQNAAQSRGPGFLPHPGLYPDQCYTDRAAPYGYRSGTAPGAGYRSVSDSPQPLSINPDSLGLVTPQSANFTEPLSWPVAAPCPTTS